MAAIARETEGVAHTLEVPGYSLLTSSNIANLGGMFIILEPFEERSGVPALQAPAILASLRQKFATIQDGIVVAFGAPPVEGLGSTGGFKLQVRDRSSRGFDALQAAVQELSAQGNQQPGLVGLFSSFRADQPQLYIDIDRAQAKNQGIPLDNVFNTLQIYLGSAYANDFTFEGRNWQVNVQADQSFRDRLDDIARLKVRNAAGKMVPMGALITVKEVTGPAIVNRYNLYPSAELSGNTLPGVSSGQAISMLDRLSAESLPQGFDHEWTELSLQEILASKDILSKLVFPLAVVFVFLVLAAQYESWSLPMAVILIVPMCLLAALAGVLIRGLDNNIFTQIGLVVLVGLAAKNAILIVEFAKTNVERGQAPLPAVVDAAKLRLRPILMTSFAFILGVLPLVIAQGAGFEMRQALGTAVFSGMLGVTFFGLLFTPIFFYAVTAWLGGVRPTSTPAAAPPAEPPPPADPAGSPPLTAIP
jgi:multidrug efflux pump